MRHFLINDNQDKWYIETIKNIQLANAVMVLIFNKYEIFFQYSKLLIGKNLKYIYTFFEF